MVDQVIKRLTASWPSKFSYDKDNPNVDIYYSQSDPNSALNTKSSFFYQKKGWDIFTYAMCIGKKLGEPISIKSSGVSNSLVTENLDEWHTAAMLSIVMSEKGIDLTIFDETTKIKTICEGYANAGIMRLIEIDKEKFKDNSIERFGDELKMFFK
jgi:hypothetical protein